MSFKCQQLSYIFAGLKPKQLFFSLSMPATSLSLKGSCLWYVMYNFCLPSKLLTSQHSIPRYWLCLVYSHSSHPPWLHLWRSSTTIPHSNMSWHPCYKLFTCTCGATHSIKIVALWLWTCMCIAGLCNFVCVLVNKHNIHPNRQFNNSFAQRKFNNSCTWKWFLISGVSEWFLYTDSKISITVWNWMKLAMPRLQTR